MAHIPDRAVRAPALALMLAAIALATPGPPRPAGAGAASGTYVALGDSYSAGVGAGRPGPSSGACLRSRGSYVYGLGRRVASFRACGGATTGDVLRRQLDAFPDGTRLVTITIGGNDAGFVDVIKACLLSGLSGCDARVDEAERFVRRELPARLDEVYDAIRRRAPQATVIVAGYPRLFGRRACSTAGDISNAEQRRLNEASNLLARTTAAAVKRHDGVRFADVREAFNGHGICSSAPRIHGLTTPQVNAFHPTARGYGTYARVIGRRL